MQTDMLMLTVAFHNFVNVPKKKRMHKNNHDVIKTDLNFSHQLYSYIKILNENV
jgi:hypothetical protein